jgi:GTPase Era involved in 16S rRNA processing
MQTFLGQSGPRTLMTIKMVENSGRDIRDFSLFPGENEILFPPNLCFKVVDSYDAGNQLIMVQCQQTETVDVILDLTEPGWACSRCTLINAAYRRKCILCWKARPPPPPSACVLLIIGECGDGKSTLVNALRDPARSEGAKAGLATRGVTKDIRVFEGKPIKGRAIQIMDTPGIGDQDVTPLSLVAMIEAKLSDHPIPISGVIVTTPAANGRIKLGAQVVQTLVEHGFIGEHKWDSIILVGTKSDKAEEDEKAFFRDNVVKDFFEKAPPGTSPKFALTTKEDVSQLVTQIGSLPGVPIEYVQPETASLAQILAAKFGIPVEAFGTAFDQMRDQLASQAKAEIEKERRALEQLRQEQAAAEAKGNAKDAEQARKIAALQEQLERHEERIARARPSIYKSVVDGITYLPRVLLKQFA